MSWICRYYITEQSRILRDKQPFTQRQMRRTCSSYFNLLSTCSEFETFERKAGSFSGPNGVGYIAPCRGTHHHTRTSDEDFVYEVDLIPTRLTSVSRSHYLIT